MNTETTPSAHKPKDLLEDLQHLVTEAEKMIGDTFPHHTDEAIDALRHRFEAAQARLVELGAIAKQRVVAGARCADQSIRANPYQSIAIAAGVGLVLGVFLGRRTK